MTGFFVQVPGQPCVKSGCIWVATSPIRWTSGSAFTSTTAALTECSEAGPKPPRRPDSTWLSCTGSKVAVTQTPFKKRQTYAVVSCPAGDLVEAREQAERALKQAEDGGWLDPEGRPLRLWGCRELGEIYSLLGEAYLAAKQYDTATMLLQLGSKMAIEGEWEEKMEFTPIHQLVLIKQTLQTNKKRC